MKEYFTFSQMPVINSEYWNSFPGVQDTYGTGVLKTLARNMAELLKKGVNISGIQKI